MKTCIWCSKSESKTSFKKLAHTIPQSLGGVYTCSNVCDDCNHFFGNHYKGAPSVETIIKETFNITRARLSEGDNIKRKVSSIYFNINMKRHSFDLKPAYKLNSLFQEKICRQLKKGLYKMFLEENERQKGNSNDSKFDFIRQFARYDLGDYPVFYFERSFPLIPMAKEWLAKPQLFLDEDSQMKYLVREPSFIEFEFFGHVFSLTTSRYWQLVFDNYIKESMRAKEKYFKGFKHVTKFNDMDLALSILND